MIIRPQQLTGDVGRSTDVVVIGSGAGGGVVAKELAQAGYGVIVLEEGGWYTREDFDFRPARSFMRFYREAGQTVTLGLPVVVLPQGKTVGGTTTINSGTCLRIHRHVLKRWHLESGLSDLAETELNLLYAAIEEYLFVKRADREVVGRNALLFLETAWSLGYTGGFLPRNAKDCEGYGMCAFGCPSGAKQSVNVSYMPDAVAAGADVYTHCRVDNIVTRGGRASGVRGHFIDPASGRRSGSIEVEARVVVLAGGAIQSPALLQRNRLCRASGQLGRNLSIHPCTGTTAVLDEVLGNPKGIPQSTYVDEFSGDGIMLEGGTLSPSVFAFSMPWGGRRHARAMAAYPRTGIFGAMISEHDSIGRVLPGTHPARPLVLYNMGREDIERLKRAVILSAEIWFKAGAKHVETIFNGFREMGPRDLSRLVHTRIRPADIYGLSAYHPMGTCRMGSDPQWSVVGPGGETWEVEDLYICDASILPTSLGVNPQLTVMALATRISGFIDDRLEAHS
jgi:choline dehydrogenase-like flavoprotein